MPDNLQAYKPVYYVNHETALTSTDGTVLHIHESGSGSQNLRGIHSRPC